MKIANIICYFNSHALFVKVETDEGVYGFGECSPMDNETVCLIIQKRLKPKLIGLNPFDIEKIEEIVLKKNYKISGQLLAIAFSGIEIALWDLKGKYLNQPVYNLLGGKYRDSIEFYGSSLSRHLSPEEECEKIKKCINDFGFKAVKIKTGSRFGNNGFIPDMEKDMEKVRSVREGIGSTCKLLIDGNGSYTYFQAIQLFEKIKQYDIYQFEEPCPYYDIEAYVKLSQKLSVPINVGEQDWNLFSFRDFISKGACHICAGDLTKCGGFSAAKRISALCRAFGILYGPHNTSRAIGLAATIQLAACTPECNYYMEYCIEDSKNDMEAYMLNIFKPVHGIIKVPDIPGLGIHMDIEKMNRTMQVVE